MNFDEAIKAHSDWKLKLQRYVKGMGDPVDVDKLSKDNVCALGCWIYGDGQKYKAHAEFQNLVIAHREFHFAASEIVKRKDRGENVKEEIVLGSKSAFCEASERVVSLLMALKRVAK